MHTIRSRLFERLKQGPATKEELAEAAWGPEWQWPATWEVVISVHLGRLKREGREIRRRIVYEL